MSTTARVVTFGVVSGLIWSAIAIFLSNQFFPFGDDVTIFISGILTGILVSFALALPLRALGRAGSIILGLISLPCGAFIFGFIVSVIQFVVYKITGTDYAVLEPRFDPLAVGAVYAFMSVVTKLAFILFPLAILTTFVLSLVVCKHEDTV